MTDLALMVTENYANKFIQSFPPPHSHTQQTTNFCSLCMHYFECPLYRTSFTQGQYIESYYTEIRYFRSSGHSVFWEKSFGLMTTFCVHYTEFGIVSIRCKETIYFRYNGYSI